jgi:hypothetical protein
VRKFGLNLRRLVAVLAILTGALGVGIGIAATTSSAVPWVDKPVTPALLMSLQPKPLPTTPPKTGAPPCTSSALEVEPAVGLQWMQNDGVAIRFRNIGTAACLFRGTPFVVATSPGNPSVVATNLRLAATGGEIADTPVGGIVSVDVSALIMCPADPGGNEQGLPVYHGLVLTLPGGTERTVSGLNLSLPCGLAVTPFSMPKPSPTYPPYRLASLRPRIALPSTVKAGGTLVYEVTLRNPLSRPVSLSPCPAYIEHSSSDIKLEYQFNCSSVHAIAAHASVVYQMKMAVPDSTPTGAMTVYWSVIGPNTTESRATVDVR